MDRTKTHYGVVGIGSIGSVFAVSLRQAGHRVSVLDKIREKVAYLRENGLKISGEIQAQTGPLEAFSRTEDFIKQDPDVVLICTKSCDSPSLLREIRDLEIKNRTVFVSCQNGLDVEDQVSESFGQNRSLRMVLNLGCSQTGESEIKVHFSFNHLLSEKPNVGPIVQRICDDFNAAGIKTKLTRDIRKEAFKKAILNSAMGGACAVTGMRMKEAMDDPEISWIVKEMIREGISVASALNLGIGSEYFDEAVGYLAKGGTHKPSMLMDIEAKRKTENECHCGRIYRLGKEVGVKVPVIQTVYYLIRRLESGSAPG